ncbi:MAG: energy-coupling factor ABC transporter ATP-binding protein [Proteobacteria bacterium]|nr:energy-coupling factor ABC transporter ATP-binding protein [Pseudomonadota bacterium]
MTALLKLDYLRKSYGERRLLDLGGLAIEAGQAYVVTGGNGAGKSTLLRILAGLEHADIAGMQFQGGSPAGATARQRIVYVHQHPYLFHTSVADNIAYGLKARGIGGAQRQRLVEEAIAWAGVGSLRLVPPGKLSGGEKQRVALARAKVLAPLLYLLDEPTANLDGEGRRQTIELVQKLAHDGAGVVIACHDREIIELPGMRHFHLDGGRLIQV